MAGVMFHVNSGETTLTGATATTILQIKAAANQRVLIRQLRLLGKQAAGGTDTPIFIRLTRSTSNFGTSSAATPAKNNPSDSETLQATARKTFTAEPTTPADGGLAWELPPQGAIEEIYPLENPIIIPGGQSAQFEATSAGAETPTLLIEATCEE